MPKRFVAFFLCLAAILSVPRGYGDPPYMGGVHTYSRSHTYTPARDTRYTVNTLRHTAAGLEEEHIFSFAPNSGLRPVLVTSDSLYHGGLTLAEAEQKVIARGYDVVGGINGSFFNSDMSPIGLQVRDGVLTSMGGVWQPAVGFTESGSAVFGAPGYGITVTGVNGEVKVDRLNQTRQSDQVFLYTDDYSSTTRTTMEGLHVVITAPGKLIPGNTLYGTVTKVLAGREPALIGKNEFVLSGNTAAAINRFSFLKEGDAVLLSVTCMDARWVGVMAALGGLHNLVGDGQVLPVDESSRAPRTAVGITFGGEIVFYTVDGRQSGYSTGLTLAELSVRMAELGCVSAFNLDGGGSTVLSVRLPGETSAKVVSRPSDGRLRKCADFLLFCNVAPVTDGQPAHLFPQPAYCTMMPGATADFSFLAADSAYRPAALPNAPVLSTSADTALGVTNGPSFTAALPGETDIYFSSWIASGSARVKIVDTLDSLTLTDALTGSPVSDLSLFPGRTVSLTASGTFGNTPILTSPRSFQWEVEGEIGTVTPDGLFTPSGLFGAKGRIRVSGGGQTAFVNVSVGGEPVKIETFENGLGVFAPSGTGINAAVTQDAGIVERGTTALQLSYSFHPVWFTALNLPLNAALQNEPRTVAALVTGDGSGHKLLLDAATSSGLVQTELGILDFTGTKVLMATLPAGVTSLTGLTIHPNLSGEPDGTFFLHELTALWMDALPDAPPTVQIGLPSFADGKWVYPVQVKDLTGSLPDEVSVRWDGEDVPDLSFDRLTGFAEVRVPAPADGYHILSVSAADQFGRRVRTSLADDLGRVANNEAIWDVVGKWYTGYVDFLDRKGVISADSIFGLRYFYPEREVTRLEVMTLISKILRLDVTAYEQTTLPFADIGLLTPEELGYVKAIVGEGIVTGKVRDGVRILDPNGTMSHAEIFTILYNTLPKGYERSDLRQFQDASSVPAFALRAAQTLVGIGVVRGNGENLGFRASMSRAEVASLFCRFFYG
ncbi:MAG: phosphodiester glycosidase family protein [Oscillospiraceae bacterium]|jgi:uncharacterized protein YigE (DUF2233 family)|nr:phosphodiester glycosidase family protein [Oscillospiraceae bacterium]